MVITGKLYASTWIPLSFIQTEFRYEKVLVKITAISIIQDINKLVENRFFLKHLNNICKYKSKLRETLAWNYKDFYIKGF